MSTFLRPRCRRRLPGVLTRKAVRADLDELSGQHRLVATFLYGAGLRLLEALRLRVKDLDFERLQVTLREGKGGMDRVTMLPGRLSPSLKDHPPPSFGAPVIVDPAPGSAPG